MRMIYLKKKIDSFFSAYQSDGYLEKEKNKYFPITINYKKRLMRQKFKNKHLQQNGSIIFLKKFFQIITTGLVVKWVYPMENWQTFELDTVDEIKNMELLFSHNLIKYYKNIYE